MIRFSFLAAAVSASFLKALRTPSSTLVLSSLMSVEFLSTFIRLIFYDLPNIGSQRHLWLPLITYYQMQVNQGNPKTLLVCLRSISSVNLACADRQKIISCIESLHD